MIALLIEDDEYKASQIENFLANEGCEIIVKKSFREGMLAVFSCEYDFLLLDMTLPSFGESSNHLNSRTRKYGGRDVLNEMQRRGIEKPVVVITQYSVFGDDETSLEELDRILHESYNSNYLGYVFYNASILDWQEKLKVYLNNLKRGID